MKKINLFCMVLLFSCLVACDDEDVNPSIKIQPAGPFAPPGPDVLSPSVNIISPANEVTFLVIESVAVRFIISAKGAIKKVRVLLNDPDTKSQVLVSNFDQFEKNESDFDALVYLPRTSISLPIGAATKRYTAIVEAEDDALSKAKDSISFIIHAPDLDKTSFIKAASQVDIYGYLDWSGYDIPQEPVAALGLALFVMIDKDFDNKISEAEWKRFALDFDLKDQAWPIWDLDRSGGLNNAEFNKGIGKLNFHTDWDLDKNSSINSHELAGGIFSRWDHNKDNVLSRNEYEERFYTYYHFGE